MGHIRMSEMTSYNGSEMCCAAPSKDVLRVEPARRPGPA